MQGGLPAAVRCVGCSNRTCEYLSFGGFHSPAKAVGRYNDIICIAAKNKNKRKSITPIFVAILSFTTAGVALQSLIN